MYAIADRFHRGDYISKTVFLDIPLFVKNLLRTPGMTAGSMTAHLVNPRWEFGPGARIVVSLGLLPQN